MPRLTYIRNTGSLSPLFTVEGTPHIVFQDWATEWYKVILRTEKPVRIPAKRLDGTPYMRELTERTNIHTTPYFKTKEGMLLFLDMVEHDNDSPYAMGWSL